jgi:hypothetical protein
LPPERLQMTLAGQERAFHIFVRARDIQYRVSQ